MTYADDLATSSIRTSSQTGNLNGQQYVFGNVYSVGGLTKREYFAAMAMQGILANGEFLEKYKYEDIYKLSVTNADFLIAELNKPTPQP